MLSQFDAFFEICTALALATLTPCINSDITHFCDIALTPKCLSRHSLTDRPAKKAEYIRYWFSVKLSEGSRTQEDNQRLPDMLYTHHCAYLMTRNQPKTCAEAGLEPASVEYESTRLPLPYTPQY